MANRVSSVVFFILMCLMGLFAAVQYNDPDGGGWMAVYAIPALWCALATFFPRWLARPLCRIGLLVCIVMALAGVVKFWPLTPRFWTKEVWYNVETAREGMGLMIVALVLFSVLVYAMRQSARDLTDASSS